MTPRSRVLLVDDEIAIQRAVGPLLRSRGYDVDIAGTGAEALALHAAATEPFQLVVSDIVMPQMTGVELAHQLLDRQPDLNLLFISSDVFVTLLRQDKRLRAYDLLTKPFRPEALQQAVRRSLENPRSFG